MSTLQEAVAALKAGEAIPYMDIGVFTGATTDAGVPLPFDSDSLILALNQGRAMPPRLMLEYSRAAMQLEQRRGRNWLEASFQHVFKEAYTPPKTMELIAGLNPSVVIDLNREKSMVELFADRPHQLVAGTARLAGDKPRYKAWRYTPGEGYAETEEIVLDQTTLLRPMGTTVPETTLILSDADYVDWLTEAMAGLHMPQVFKDARADKLYVFLGCRFNRDTERMVAHEMTLGLKGGWWLLEGEPNKAELKFAERHNLIPVTASLEAFNAALSA